MQFNPHFVTFNLVLKHVLKHLVLKHLQHLVLKHLKHVKRNFVDTFIYNSEKKTTPIYLSNFFKYNAKNHITFAVCSCLNYIFLLIFADVIGNKRINQT